MKITTKVGVVLLLVAATSVIVGAGSFTSTEADRGVNVSVVDDANAYIGFQRPNGDWEKMDSDSSTDYEVSLNPSKHTETYDDGSALIEIDLPLLSTIQLFPAEDDDAYVYENVINITNQFDEDLEQLDIDVEFEDDNEHDKSDFEDVDSLGVGESASMDLACPSDDSDFGDLFGWFFGEDDPEDQLSYNYSLDIDVVGNTTSGDSGRFDRSVEVICEEHM